MLSIQYNVIKLRYQPKVKKASFGERSKTIYEAFFGLKEQPFSVQPDPRYAYPSKEHQIAIAKIGYAADHKKGLGVLTGPIGVGKTTVANYLLGEWANDKTKTVGFLPSASVRTPASFLRLVLEAYGEKPTRNAADCERFLQLFLLRENEQGRHPILLVDEGQMIHPDNIDMISALTNFQTAQSKLITVIILAQDNFPNKIKTKDAFRSRIAITVHLDPLAFDDTCGMISHRLKTAGGGPIEQYFTEDALHALFDVTEGVPRDICVLGDNLLVNGYVHDKRVIDAELVHATVAEMAVGKGWKIGNKPAVSDVPSPPPPNADDTTELEAAQRVPAVKSGSRRRVATATKGTS